MMAESYMRIFTSMISTVKILIACLALSISMAHNAHAYIDPGSGAFLWQLALAGFFGALFFVSRLQCWVRNTIKGIWAKIRGVN